MFQPARAAIAALTAVSIIATACSSGTAGPGASGSAATGGKPYAGTTLRVLGANHPWADALKPLLPDFETKTGIKVNLEQYGEDQLTQKLTTEFTAGSSDVDAFMQRPLQEAKLHQQNGYYTDLNPYLKDTKKTPADYDTNDLSKAALGTETVGDTLTGIPIVVEAEVLYYRKDLLQAAGLSVPKTLDELKTAAAKLTDKSKEQYGFVARGQRSPSVTQFSSFRYSFGGDWFDLKTKKATTDTPGSIQAATSHGLPPPRHGPPRAHAAATAVGARGHHGRGLPPGEAGAARASTRITTGASLNPDSASSRPVSRRGSGTRRSTEHTAAASVEARTAPTSSAMVHETLSTKCAASPTTATETTTPRGDSSAAVAADRRMPSHEVVSPPSARIRTRAL